MPVLEIFALHIQPGGKRKGRVAKKTAFPSTLNPQPSALLSLLALFTLTCAFATGCHKQQPARPEKHFVRFEALLTLHPAWAQVVSLDRDVAALAAPQPTPAGITLNLPPLPHNFTPPESLPINLVQQRERRLQEDAERYVTHYRNLLQARNRQIYARYEQAQRVATNNEYRRELAAEEARIRQEQTAKAQSMQQQIDALGFREVALETQVKAYTGQPHEDALQQQHRVTADIAALSQRRTELLASIEPTALAAMVERRKQLDAALQQNLAQRRQQLDQELASQVAREQARLQQAPPPIAAIGSVPTPPITPLQTPLPLPTRTETQVAMQQAQGQEQIVLASERATWQSQKEKLIAVIRADTAQAVIQIARKNGWQIVPAATPGATDVTQEVSAALRAQWGQIP